MLDNIVIKEIKHLEDYTDSLSELLMKVVNSGASIGFMSPLSQRDAKRYWENVLDAGVVLYIAEIQNQIVGSIQLHLSLKENGKHRVEIAKLMVDTDYRRKGIGKMLMIKAEDKTKQEKRTLIVLDTREGDPSNQLYKSMGYVQAGRIPCYAKSSDGKLDATNIYYKLLSKT